MFDETTKHQLATERLEHERCKAHALQLSQKCDELRAEGVRLQQVHADQLVDLQSLRERLSLTEELVKKVCACVREIEILSVLIS